MVFFSGDIHGMLVARFTGISPLMAEEICHRAGIDPALSFAAAANFS